jgi:UDP-N-acetylglucosamine--dolichyl-phosphate N-acetylglucosaminephosphotransferase
MEIILFLSIIISFILTLLILRYWIKKCRKIGLLWEDMNKFNHPKNVAASGGVVVVMCFILGVFSYIAIKTFIFEGDGTTIKIFALLSVILILSMVGLVDDLFGWQHGGLSARFRILLAFLASIPLVVINAGSHQMGFPFLGVVNFGILYTFVILPIGVAGATTTYNMLAGFNGLEAGQGIIILSFLSFISYSTGNSWLALIGLCMVATLIGFYFHNKFPAKVFPGDVLTYSVGAMIACMAILGNFEKVAVFVFMLYIMETLLKLRGGLKKQSFGLPQKDGSLEMPYNKIYGMTHLSIFILKKFKKKVFEKDVVYFIFALQIIICLIALLIFKGIIPIN